MALYWIRHAERLRGELEIHTAKNAVLPILCAGLLTREPLRIEGVPHLTDVDTLWAILQDCGAQICREGDALTLFTPEPVSPVEEDLAQPHAGLGTGHGPAPGPHGLRPGRAARRLRHWAASIDLHLKGMQALGAESTLTPGSVTLQGTLRGGRCIPGFSQAWAPRKTSCWPPVLAQGVTRIENAAKEPEIVDLCALLSRMGAKIRGCGTSTLYIEGCGSCTVAFTGPFPTVLRRGPSAARWA